MNNIKTITEIFGFSYIIATLRLFEIPISPQQLQHQLFLLKRYDADSSISAAYCEIGCEIELLRVLLNTTLSGARSDSKLKFTASNSSKESLKWLKSEFKSW